MANLPSYLVERYQQWRSGGFEKNRTLFEKLAEQGQSPQAMVISCCDSRVHANVIFGEGTGEFFIHRNVANLIPPYSAASEHSGTSVALEYAVSVLKVKHILVLGHSDCGGIKAGFHLFNGTAGSEIKESRSFQKWLAILKPAFASLDSGEASDDEKIAALEKRSIVASLDNLLSFPFIREAVEGNKLTLHGLWHDIGSGALLYYNSDSETFDEVSE